jgi:hypothetical protein
MADCPDVYADGFSVTVGPFGVTLTLSLSQPTGAPGPHEDPTEVVARVRESLRELTTHSDALTQILAMSAQQQAQTTSTIKH